MPDRARSFWVGSIANLCCETSSACMDVLYPIALTALRIDWHADAVVVNFESEVLGRHLQIDDDGVCLGVADHIVQDLFDHHHQFVPNRRSDGDFGHVINGRKLATDFGGAEILLGIAVKVSGKTFQAIVAGVHCPNDLIELSGEIMSGLIDFSELLFGESGIGHRLLGKIRKQADAGQARTEIIMQVARDAGALDGERVLLMKLEPRNIAPHGGDGASDQQHDHDPEPPLTSQRQLDAQIDLLGRVALSVANANAPNVFAGLIHSRDGKSCGRLHDGRESAINEKIARACTGIGELNVHR